MRRASEIAGLHSRAHRAEQALETLSALIEAAPFPMWHRAPDLRLTLVNAAYVRAVEAENAAEVVARGLELVDLTGKDSPQAAAARAREQEEPTSRIVPATMAGERRRVRIADVPLGSAGVAGFAVDVEELEQARAELARFARAQREMLDLLSSGVAQFGPDRDLVFYNQPFQRIFEMKPEWLADHPEFDRVLDRMREAERLPASRDFPEWKAERREWFRSGDEPVEENWLLSGGTHLRVVAQPLPNGGLLLIFEDRTEQVQLASARDTLLRVRTATFDNLVEGIAVFAGDGRLHLWNRRFREIWELEETLLTEHPRIDALLDGLAGQFEQRPRADAIQEAVRVATGDRQARSGHFALRDGRHFDFAAVPLPDGNALFTLLDVTDSQRIQSALRERNEALEAADRLKTDFVSNMSYELRTPLTSIAGFAEMLAGGYAGELPEAAGDYVGSILESVGKLRTQIDEILDLAQSEAGGLPLAQDEVDLKRLCEEAATEARAAAGRRGHELATEIDWSVGSVTGDAIRLRQAIDHLLRNAIQYTPEGGRVLLHAEGDAGEA
ncbi:MAG: PAS-domain containing protein, partial [Sphingomonadales bacterium]|nr:PAS-domain containing protein [Sphingomonadales bacterium]